VRDFVTMAFRAIGVTVAWEGSGANEVGIDVDSKKTLIRVNPRFYRPAEVDMLVGNAAKAQADLGWRARTTLEQLCQMMVDADLRRIASGISY
jgi:GDPmannose 4,6-dehydratase